MGRHISNQRGWRVGLAGLAWVAVAGQAWGQSGSPETVSGPAAIPPEVQVEPGEAPRLRLSRARVARLGAACR